MSGRTAVITGGTSGIGAALASLMRSRGDRVIVLGRRVNGEDSIAVDLRNADAAHVVESGLKSIGVDRWDMLIHNAAAGWVGAIPEQPCSEIRDLLEVNLWAPIALTQRLLKSASERARVVFISSPVAHVPGPDYAVYAASKAGLEAFARSLRAERIGVEVQVLRPGATATEMLSDADAERLGITKKKFASAESVAAKLLQRIDGPPRWTSCDAVGNLAVGLDRWGHSAWLNRAPRIEWPSFAVGLRGDGTRRDSSKALVTGAADGIGRALAMELAKQGFEVVGVDRDEERLMEARNAVQKSGGVLHPIVANLADASSLERLAESLSEFGPFDAVIHNAGINRFGRFADSDLDEQRTVFEVNLLAPILLTQQLFASRLVAEGCRFGFVSSLSHFVGYPGSAVYAATKTALASYAESLAACGSANGFSVTTIFPGPTRTRQAFENSPDNSRQHKRMEPSNVAEKIVRAMMKRKRILIPGSANRLLAAFARRFPSLADSLMRKALLKPR